MLKFTLLTVNEFVLSGKRRGFVIGGRPTHLFVRNLDTFVVERFDKPMASSFWLRRF